MTWSSSLSRSRLRQPHLSSPDIILTSFRPLSPPLPALCHPHPASPGLTGLPQYRLGPLGFLSTEDAEAPGNLGLLDQVAALRWVQAHIGALGGDPSLVTLAGLSAGGASVHYLHLSPRARGLFHRAVTLSGSALCWWASLPRPGRTARALGAALACPTSPSAALLACLRARPAEEIIAAQGGLYPWHAGALEREPMNLWSPRVDQEAGAAALLPQGLEEGEGAGVPLLVGVDETEGAWRAINFLGQPAVLQEFLEDFPAVLPLVLGLKDRVGGRVLCQQPPQVDPADLPGLVEQVSQLYFGQPRLTSSDLARVEEIAPALVNLMGDSMFNMPIDAMTRAYGESPGWLWPGPGTECVAQPGTAGRRCGCTSTT